MATIANATIDLNAIKIAGTSATGYITKINNGGIKVHDVGDSNNYIQLTSAGMEIFKTDGASNPSAVSIAQFGGTVRIGEESAAHINITSGGLDVYNNTQLIGHWGYDSSSATNPYFTFGTRATTSSKPGHTAAKGAYSTVLGYNCIAGGQYSFAQGYFCEAQAVSTHAEGYSNVVAGEYAHAEGHSNFIDGNSHYSHVEGRQNVINGSSSLGVNRQGWYAHVGGINNIVNHDGAFVHGQYLRSTTPYQALFGKFNDDADNALLVIGNGTADDARSNLMVVGDNDIRIGNTNNSYMQLDASSFKMIDKEGVEYASIEDLRGTSGTATLTVTFFGDGEQIKFNLNPPAINNSYTVNVSDSSGGTVTKATDYVSFSTAPTEGSTITVTYSSTSQLAKIYTFGFRNNSTNKGACSICVGVNGTASGNFSFVAGTGCMATGYASHAEGGYTTASGEYSHAEGYGVLTKFIGEASGKYSHVEGHGTTASGTASHAQNEGTIAAASNQTAIGKYNIQDATTYAFIIGNGTYGVRSNALTVDWQGNLNLPTGNFSGVGLVLDYNSSKSNTNAISITNNTSNAFTVEWDGDVLAKGGINIAVEEIGSNYIRYSNGLQICWLNTSVNMAIDNQYGSSPLYTGTYTWTFPKAFSSAPTVTVGAVKWSTGASWGSANAATTTSVVIRGTDYFSRASDKTTHIEAMAIGYWQ